MAELRHLAAAVLLRAVADAFCSAKGPTYQCDAYSCGHCRSEALRFLLTSQSEMWISLTEMDGSALRQEVRRRMAQGAKMRRWRWVD